MLRRLPHVFTALVLVTLSAALPIRSSVHAAASHALLVIVGNSTDMTNISFATLRRAFQGEVAVTPSGKRLVPLNQQLGTAERTLFDRVVLGLEPGDVGRYWINRRIRDEGLPPRTLPSLELGVRVVASYPGAITYVSADMVSPAVRVLRIDGKLPGEPGYLLARR